MVQVANLNSNLKEFLAKKLPNSCLPPLLSSLLGMILCPVEFLMLLQPTCELEQSLVNLMLKAMMETLEEKVAINIWRMDLADALYRWMTQLFLNKSYKFI